MSHKCARAVALKLLHRSDKPDQAYYIEPPEAGINLEPAITAIEGIGDLPPIDARAQLRSGELKRGARRFDKPIPWDGRCKVSDYARLMRTWQGFEAGDVLMDHVIHYLPRDFRLFARMNASDQYPQAWKHAHDMLNEQLAELRRAGRIVRKGSEDYERLHR